MLKETKKLKILLSNVRATVYKPGNNCKLLWREMQKVNYLFFIILFIEYNKHWKIKKNVCVVFIIRYIAAELGSKFNNAE